VAIAVITFAATSPKVLRKPVQTRSCRLLQRRSADEIPDIVPQFRRTDVRGGTGFVQALIRPNGIAEHKYDAGRAELISRFQRPKLAVLRSTK
jgi:hypothetical protein